MKKIILALVVFLSLSMSAIAGVNINTATQAELESLNGIGPKKAQAIIDYRKKNGDFKSVDDLKNIEGIGDKTLMNLRKDTSVTGKTSIPAPAAKNAKANVKDAKVVGNEKAATSGKTAEDKIAKEKTKK